MKGKFVLAKHGQIYEPERLSSSVLTMDINVQTSGGMYHMGNYSCV